MTRWYAFPEHQPQPGTRCDLRFRDAALGWMIYTSTGPWVLDDDGYWYLLDPNGMRRFALGEVTAWRAMK